MRLTIKFFALRSKIMKAITKLALVAAALSAACFMSCSSDDDSDYDDNAKVVAFVRQPTTWKATSSTYTSKEVDAVAKTSSTYVVETDYSTGNTKTTITTVDKDGKSSTTVQTVDHSTGKTTTKVDDKAAVTGEAVDSDKYTSYDYSDVLKFAFDGTYTKTTTEKYVKGNKTSYTEESTEKGSFSGYPTLANQTITLAPTSSESSYSSSNESTKSSTASSNDSDSPSVVIGKVSSDKNTLTVTSTITRVRTSKTDTKTDSDSTTTATFVVTYVKQ